MCDEDEMGYICKVLRIVTGTQRVLNKCNNGSDYANDANDGVPDDSDSEGSLLSQGRLVLASGMCALGTHNVQRSGSNKN